MLSVFVNTFIATVATMLGIIIIGIITVLSFCVYKKYTNAIYQSDKRLDGKTVIVTGGTAGIGLLIARDLANRAAKVIIACPFEDEGNNARNKIITDTGNQEVYFKILDLASLASVRLFATDILSSEDRLNVLINNAGVGIPKDVLTNDGMNFIMQVNYYGTFLLSLLLLPLLIKTGTLNEPSRIVSTSSVLHKFGKFDINNANSTNYWNKVRIYSNSKICLIYFARELTKRLNNSNVVINNVHPGLVGTRIYESANKIIGLMTALICKIFFKTVWEGAQTTLYATLDETAGKVSGAYFENCKEVKAVKHAYDEETAKVLWEDSLRLTKITTDELDKYFISS